MPPETPTIDPHETGVADADAALRSDGFVVVRGDELRHAVGLDDASALRWASHWSALPTDPHLRDGGRYRRRRHGCFVVDGHTVRASPPRAHWQPVDYNALHGGIERWFEPLGAGLVAEPAWSSLLVWLGARASVLRGQRPWFTEAHAFRIETHGGIGRPTPEGAHRDGVDLVAVILLARHGVRGGETRVFEAHGPKGTRFMLRTPWTALLLDDARVVHETTPIQPLGDPDEGYRDTLVVTLRAGAFQAPEPHGA